MYLCISVCSMFPISSTLSVQSNYRSFVAHNLFYSIPESAPVQQPRPQPLRVVIDLGVDERRSPCRHGECRCWHRSDPIRRRPYKGNAATKSSDLKIAERLPSSGSATSRQAGWHTTAHLLDFFPSLGFASFTWGILLARHGVIFCWTGTSSQLDLDAEL